MTKRSQAIEEPVSHNQMDESQKFFENEHQEDDESLEMIKQKKFSNSSSKRN